MKKHGTKHTTDYKQREQNWHTHLLHEEQDSPIFADELHAQHVDNMLWCADFARKNVTLA